MAEPILQKSDTLAAPNSSPFDQLPKVVVAHLTLEKARGNHPSEGSLSSPIQSYLGGRRSGRSSWDSIDQEENHPAFRDKRLGRKFQIDFVGKVRKRKKTDPGGDKPQRFAFALETKLHIPNSDWGRIVRDLVKLLLLSDSDPGKDAEKYMLLAFPISSGVNTSKQGAAIIKSPSGERISLNQPIWVRGEKDLNLFEALLPHDRPKLEVRLGDLRQPIQSKFHAALKEFGKISIPGNVEIRKIGLDWSDDYACGIWRLLATGRPFEIEQGVSKPTPKS